MIADAGGPINTTPACNIQGSCAKAGIAGATLHLLASVSEAGVFRQETIAGMDRLRPCNVHTV